MPDDRHQSQLPAVPPDNFSVVRPNSRLLQRGVAWLNETRSIRLIVIGLIADGGSLFMQARMEDAEKYLYSTKQEQDRWKEWRYITLYEFSTSGSFIRVLRLPLLEFRPEWTAAVVNRFPGNVKVGTQLIHYSETFVTKTELSFDDIRIDYLFSRLGERLAVWSDSNLPDMYRSSGSAYVPTGWDIRPEWIVDDQLVSVAVETPALNPNGAGYTEAPIHQIRVADENEFLQAIAFAQPEIPLPGDEELPFDADVASIHRLQFPVPSYVIGGNESDLRLRRGWSSCTHDARSIWFLSDSRSLVWRMDLQGKLPIITCYSLPHPLDLFRSGVTTLRDQDHKRWVPTQDHYDRFENWNESDGDRVLLSYELHSCFDNRVLITVSGELPRRLDWQQEGVLVLFEVQDDGFVPLRAVGTSDDRLERLLEISDRLEREEFDKRLDRIMAAPRHLCER